MSAVAKAMDPSHSEVLIETIELERGNGDLEVELDWVPLDDNPIHGVETSSDSLTIHSRQPGQNPTGKGLHSSRGQLHLRLLWAHNLHNVEWIGSTNSYIEMRVSSRARVK